METRGSMPHSQASSNNPYLDPNQANSRIDTYFLRFILIMSSYLRLGLSADVPVKILKALLPFSIKATFRTQLNLLDLITLTLLS
jgi:hypothetical protein